MRESCLAHPVLAMQKTHRSEALAPDGRAKTACSRQCSLRIETSVALSAKAQISTRANKA
jgi:hypothetical protein